MFKNVGFVVCDHMEMICMLYGLGF